VTHAEQIMEAVAFLIYHEGKNSFSRKEIRDRIGISQEEWHSGYTAIFQGMRGDQPGKAPRVTKRYRGVFRQVRHGEHTLTVYGKRLLKEWNR